MTLNVANLLTPLILGLQGARLPIESWLVVSSTFARQVIAMTGAPRKRASY